METKPIARLVEVEDEPTILLVDDEKNVLKSLKRILRGEGYNIITRDNGPDALEVLKSEDVQLIISDQRMVPMAGTEFLEKAREIKPDAIRILLTGYSEIQTAEEAINRVEIYRFLNKPWNDADLKATIRQGLRKNRLERENRRLLKTLEQRNAELKQWNVKLETMVDQRTKQLREAQAQLIQSEKMASLGVMAGGVAHEINNPLGGILGITQVLLSEHPDGGQLTQDLKVIEEAVTHCTDIVKNLLAFSRKSDRGARSRVDAEALVDKVLVLLGHKLRDRMIEVEKDFDPGLKGLYVNEQQIQQVITNLVINAEQSMKPGGKINIRGIVTASGSPVIEVEDEGEGISESELDKIFDPFFTTKPEGQGTGLGLSVCYRIMEEHEGTIEVRSEKGKGSLFRMVFPWREKKGGGERETAAEAPGKERRPAANALG